MTTGSAKYLPFAFRDLPAVQEGGHLLVYSPFRREILSLGLKQATDPHIERSLAREGYFPPRIEIWNADIPMRNVVLCVTTKCSLSCPYCAAASDITPPNMPAGLARSVLDSAIRTRNGKPILVHFSGGEPTLNFPCISESLTYLKQQKVDFVPTITINGSVANNILDFLAAERFNIFISLDSANPLIQNTMRPPQSFLAALRTIARAGRRCHQVGIRTTVSRLNVSGLCELVDLCGDLGVKSIIFQPLRTELGRAPRTVDLRPDASDYVKQVLDAMAKCMSVRVRFGETLLTQHLGGDFMVPEALAVLPNGEITIVGPAANRPRESVIGFCDPKSGVQVFQDRIGAFGERFFRNVERVCRGCMAVAICRGQVRRYEFVFTEPAWQFSGDFHCDLSRKLISGFIRNMWREHTRFSTVRIDHPDGPLTLTRRIIGEPMPT